MLCSSERNIQIMIEVLKANGIRNVIVSPGTTNASFVSSLQSDSFFNLISAPEERSAAYMACGMAAETGKPVVLSCTGATASRNYMPGLTEAFYRKLPVIAITSSRRNAFIGHNMHQVTDRTLLPRDIANISVQMPVVLDEIDEWQCTINANKAVQELFRRGGGPVHVNMETTYSRETVSTIKDVRIIKRYTVDDILPEIIASEKIIIFVGSHLPFNDELTDQIDLFCEKHNAIVLCDHTSNYKGKFRVFGALLCSQHSKTALSEADLLIHIGEVSSVDLNVKVGRVWRLNPDGEMKDTFMRLDSVFEMKEIDFFKIYLNRNTSRNLFIDSVREDIVKLYDKVPSDLPFSSTWIASVTSNKLPIQSSVHFGIRNSLKTWNYFDIPTTVSEFSNTGGFGIDGCVSTLVGAALSNPNKVHFLILGDLAFFYDLSVFGNRHLPNNIRIIVVNNGLGYEMRGYFTLGHRIADCFSVDERDFICADGHYHSEKGSAVKNFVESFGCKYFSAANKEEFFLHINDFLSGNNEKPVVFECFVKDEDEDEAFKKITNVFPHKVSKLKQMVKSILKK